MPDEPASPSPAGGGRQPADAGAVHALVRQVIALYTERILAGRRATAPDEARLAQLMEGQRACIADQQRLRSAELGPAEVEQSAARCAALHARLTTE
ncbi:hypothetical protein OEIGOIKO_00615 [Streptomyces chrestomyceticus JCM 4735]|uniref:Uncharacterized protein n=1 Tax=Streptomyces chrestomyceticus JCM 4735 TaxID=1306181 RepID=A0A7U9KQD1_9ACTN|nr:hypothetical protein [Streptomyces chrestomyceticus]GCD32897.1 hypothetical protein OEIGOIKO_00615 [Streptomyces chrestomyceticus JCM 4735]